VYDSEIYNKNPKETADFFPVEEFESPKRRQTGFS